MNLADKLGLSQETLTISTQSAKEGIVLWQNNNNNNNNPSLLYTKYNFLFSYHALLTKCPYLQDQKKEAYSMAKLIYARANDYLFGDWQKNVQSSDTLANPLFFRNHLPWLDVLRISLMWASSVNQWEEIKHLISFVYNKQNGEINIDAKQYYITLQIFLADEENPLPLLKQIINSRNKKYRQMAQILEAIYKKTMNVQDFWYSSLKWWFQQESKSDWSLAPEATFLYHLSLQRGITVALDEHQMNHIVHFNF
jgi:hypothetical protein